MRLVLCGLSLAGILVGCDPVEVTDSLRVRAAYDFQCPRSELLVTDLTRDDMPSTFGVRGCGHQATYVHTPQGAWIMNNDLERSHRRRDREDNDD